VNVINSVVASPIVFLVGVMTLVGWLIFSVFAGVGLASLPYDWLLDFKYRPKPITAAE
jgi:LMBR1 domain-containing protein 1